MQAVFQITGAPESLSVSDDGTASNETDAEIGVLAIVIEPATT
jgi:hypothetical protein